MDILFVALVPFLASEPTLFSGFGLSTILTLAFALPMPVEMVVGASALVQMANNLSKLALVGGGPMLG
ncbi:hypothetical protein [Tabrizicola soli]|uniref:TRAP C4-dicarboxylate transport system permease DctM subunit domain-containing protein n=1 Tax=Tabrizicola soli TaxID=2185115 RepID=A0ABV7DQU3_9RHOB|nr:hypothetical protein [Tabrizicola soli]